MIDCHVNYLLFFLIKSCELDPTLLKNPRHIPSSRVLSDSSVCKAQSLEMYEPFHSLLASLNVQQIYDLHQLEGDSGKKTHTHIYIYIYL